MERTKIAEKGFMSLYHLGGYNFEAISTVETVKMSYKDGAIQLAYPYSVNLSMFAFPAIRDYVLKTSPNYGPDKIDPYKLDAFTRSYLETALWSSLDWDNQEEGNPVEMDRDHGVEDFAHSTLSKLVFIAQTWRDHMGDILDDLDISEERAGHCLWLDQNGHGAGFRDEFHLSKEIREKLFKAAQTVKEINLYVGEDNKIHA